MPARTSIVPVAMFYAAYMVLASIMAVLTGNLEFAVYIGVMLVLGVVVYFLHRKLGFSRGVLWGLGLWGLLHMMGGLIHVPETWPINGDKRVLYSLWLIPEYFKYDMLVHAYGFGIATWACWQGLRTILSKSIPAFGRLALCVLAGMGLGALNEIIEFLTTLAVPGTNVGGYLNTGWDLIFNMLGCLTAAVLIASPRFRRK
jgi:hypothetical protein